MTVQFAEITAADRRRFREHLERRRFGKGKRIGNPRSCYCPACGERFDSVKKMKHHRDKEHRL